MPLFSDGDLRNTLENSKARMIDSIEALDSRKLLSTHEDTLADYFVGEYEVQPLVIATPEQVTVEVVPTKVDARGLPDRVVIDSHEPVLVDGTLVRLRVPFTGDPKLLKLHASTWSPYAPEGEVAGNNVVFTQSWGATPSNEVVNRWINKELSTLGQSVAYQTADLGRHNTNLRPTALQVIRKRKSHLLASQNLQASLPFKMHPRTGAPLTFVPDGVKKKTITLPPVSQTPFRPEPALSDAQFEDILRTIRAMGHSMERTPAAYASLGEEDLRSILLTSLNAQFEGGATGETFNVSGKTDILIRQGDRNLFIAECKIWDGSKTLTGAIDQVLGYLAWRDTRAAVVLFVRRKDFGNVVKKIPETVTQHAQVRRELSQPTTTEWHYRLAQPSDPAREVTLAVMTFHLSVAA